jgi:hypothetical protein
VRFPDRAEVRVTWREFDMRTLTGEAVERDKQDETGEDVEGHRINPSSMAIGGNDGYLEDRAVPDRSEPFMSLSASSGSSLPVSSPREAPRTSSSIFRLHPQPVPPIYQPEVAERAIVWVADNYRREVSVAPTTSAAIVGENSRRACSIATSGGPATTRNGRPADRTRTGRQPMGVRRHRTSGPRRVRRPGA